jgi:AcrR family transcriptional regulator
MQPKMATEIVSKKHAVILSTARDLFWKHGFKRVSIEELCLKAKVSKMTFYKFFPNKIELAKRVFINESEAGLKKFKSILRENNPPAETLKKIVQLKLDGSSEISKDFLLDFYGDNNEGLKDFVMQASRTAWLKVIEEIREAQRQQLFTSSIKPELLMHFTQAIGSLITNKELLEYYANAHDLISELTYLMAYGLEAKSNAFERSPK